MRSTLSCRYTTRSSCMLKATIENFPIRGSREMLRRMETSALVSTGCRAAEEAFCGAKLTRTLTFKGGSLLAR